MTNINGIDYSLWTNQKAIKIAQNNDKDGVNGLQGTEIFNFAKEAKLNNFEKTEISELLGLNVSKNRAASNRTRDKHPDFDKAANYYNTVMSDSQRHSVTTGAEDNIVSALHKMEQDIDQAYIDCAAFNDSNLMVVLSSPFRYYRYASWINKLLNFDIDELRTRTTNNMNSLNEIRDKLEYIIEEAKGETNHTTPAKTEYDVDALAQKHFGMSYEEFAAMYPDELENCKYVTYATLSTMNETQAYVYSRAKAYAAEMLDITLNEAHNVHWDIQERKLYESLDASGDIYLLSEFEYDGITPEGIAEFKSDISYNGFEKALISKYQELNPTSVSEVKEEESIKKPVKRIVNGNILIFNPDGSVYTLKGEKIK